MIFTAANSKNTPTRRAGRGGGLGLALAGALLLGPALGRAQFAPDSVRLLLKVAVPELAYRTYAPALEYRTGQYVSVELAPRLTTGTVPSRVSPLAHDADDEVRGYGGRLAGRLYLPNTTFGGLPLAGCYLSIRAEYQHLRLTYPRTAWGEDLADDGLRYYVLRPRPFSETIRRVGGAAVVGYQFPVISSRLRFDTSLAFNQFYSKSSIGDATRYNSSGTDYGASGSFLNVDVGLGYMLK